MTPQLIKFNQFGHDAEITHAQTELTAYNKLLADIAPHAKAVNLTITAQVMAGLLKNPTEFAFDTIVKDNVLTVAGIKVTKSKAMDLIEFPDGWVKIIELVKAFNQSLIVKSPAQNHYGNHQNFTHVDLQHFDFVDGKFVLGKTYLEAIKNQYSHYTQSEGENKALALALKIKESMFELQKMGIGISHFMTLEDLGYSHSMTDGVYALEYDPLTIINKARENNI